MSRTIKLLISNWPRTREFSQLLQTGKLLLTFLTMVTRWSRSTSNVYVVIGQKLIGEFIRKIYAASWNLFTDSWNWRSFVYKRCEAFNCLCPLDAQNEIQMLARFLSYSWLVCLLVFWLRNAPLVKVIGNPISDGSLLLTSPCLMRIIKRVQKSLMRFWRPSGASWLVSLIYYCIWWFFFSGFLKSSVVSAPSLCTRQWSTIASGLT